MIGKQVALIQVPNQALFSLKPAAQFLGISPDTLIKLAEEGRIPCYDFIGRRTFKLEDLENLRKSLPEWQNHARPTCVPSERTA